ncbi:MAG: hypothetical protein JWM99_45 [Verrucomicrobiales bacterium]|nr:hypothetical protein [Verrucomicrobiales bacterium]
MSFSYRNRFNAVYFLVEKKAPAKKPKLYFSQKDESGPATLPEGFEVFENPRGQVFLRRIGTQVIKADELELVQKVLSKLGLTNRFEPWIDKNRLTLYDIPSARQAVMRFVLMEKKKRIFMPERFCFRGSVDDWISIGGPGTLLVLCQKYCRHLGKESLYELY